MSDIDYSGCGFVGAILTARMVFEQCSLRDQQKGDRCIGLFAWCATVARDLSRLHPHRFPCRDNATFSFKVNSSTLDDPLASISVKFFLDERDHFTDPAVAESSIRAARRPAGPRGEQFARISMEVEDRRNQENNPCRVTLVSMDDAVYWYGVSDDRVADVNAAIRGCGAPHFLQNLPQPKSVWVVLWGGSRGADRLAIELLRSAQGQCVNCGTTQSVKRCDVCKRATYCSRKCQLEDWKTSYGGVRHKEACAAGAPEAAARALVVMSAVAAEILAIWKPRPTP